MHDVTEALRTLGLTEWEARSYEALVALGETTAPRVAEVANVPRTRVYALLDSLEVKGWAESENVRPKRFRAVPPAQALPRGQQRLDQSIRTAREKLDALHSQEGARWAGSVWLLSGRHAIFRRLKAIIASSRSDLIWSRSTTIPGDDEILASVARAAERGVRVRLLVPKPELAPIDAGSRRVEARQADLPLWVVFADGNQAFNVFAIRDQGKVTYRGLWNPNRDLVEIFVSVLEASWMSAKVLETATRPVKKNR